MSQPDLFSRAPLSDGPGLEPEDHKRLAAHLVKVLELMSDGKARTAEQIAAIVGCKAAAAGSRCRDLRKPKHGLHDVKCERVSGGQWIYRLEK